MDIKDFIKNRRIELGLTQAEVAKACAVSEGTVSRWESGDIESMKRNRISALARVLQIDPVTLLDDEIDIDNADTSKDDIKVHSIAAHATRDLTEEEAEEVLKFAEFIKAKRLRDK